MSQLGIIFAIVAVALAISDQTAVGTGPDRATSSAFLGLICILAAIYCGVKGV